MSSSIWKNRLIFKANTVFIYGRFNDDASNWDYNSQWTINFKGCGRTRQYHNFRYHLAERTHEKSKWSISGSRFEPWTSQIRSMSVTLLAAGFFMIFPLTSLANKLFLWTGRSRNRGSVPGWNKWCISSVSRTACYRTVNEGSSSRNLAGASSWPFTYISVPRLRMREAISRLPPPMSSFRDADGITGETTSNFIYRLFLMNVAQAGQGKWTYTTWRKGTLSLDSKTLTLTDHKHESDVIA